MQRYKELRNPSTDGGFGDAPFEIDPYLTDLNTGAIDFHYMNSRFEKWKKQLEQEDISKEELDQTMQELHHSFAFLSQEDQKFANLFLHDVQAGDIKLESGMTFQDYVNLYAKRAKDDQISHLNRYLGVDEELVRAMLKNNLTYENLNEYGRFDTLKATVDKDKAREYFSNIEGKNLPLFRVNNLADKLLTSFLLNGGCDVPEPKE